MTKRVEVEVKCQYCLKTDGSCQGLCASVQLLEEMKRDKKGKKTVRSYSPKIWVCKACRKYLGNKIRYV